MADRDPAWSPDGKWIAYFSDESGEYALHLRAQNGMGDVRKINLGNPPSFFYGPTWSPDSKKIAYTDTRLNLWYADLDKPTPGEMAKYAPTVGALFLLTSNHVMMHAGQFTVVRRKLGKPVLF